MADPREGQGSERPPGAPARYPSVRQDDAVERPGRKPAAEVRSFDPSVDAPTPRQSEGAPPLSRQDGLLGPQGDPAEGKR